MKFDSKQFRMGIEKFAEAAGVDTQYRQQFEDIVVRESQMAADQVKEAGAVDQLTKQASTEDATELEKAILKVAATSEDSEEDEEDDSESEKSAASMGSGKGSEGRQALAERFYDGNEFDHSACHDAMKDESGISDAHRYCRDLAKLVGRGHEATRGESEGEQPGE